MKLKLTYRGYSDAYLEASGQELEVLQRLLSRAVTVSNDTLYGEEPSLTLDGKKVRFAIEVMPEHTKVITPETPGGAAE